MKLRPLLFSFVSANLILMTLPVPAQQTGNGTGSAADQAALPLIHVQGEKEAAPPAAQRKIRPMGAAPEKASITQSVTTPVSVVDSQDIDRLNTLSTLDLLERIPNVTVNRAGGIAGTIFMRGLNSNDMRIPMFIDGDRFRGRNTLQFMLIGPTEIERVEVIRGPNSSRFGSDGLVGLVNFVTKRASGNLDHPFTITGGEASLTYRSNDHGVQTNVAVEGAGSGLDVRAYATTRRGSNYESPQGEVPNSDYRSLNGGVVVGYMPDASQRVEASVRRAYVEDGAPPVVATAATYTARRPLTVTQARLAYSGSFANAVVSKLDASLYRNEFDTTMDVRNRANPVIVTNSHVVGPVVYGGRMAATVPWASTETTLGVDFMTEHRGGTETNVTTASTSTGYIKGTPDEYQTNVGAFVDTKWQAAPRWTVTAGGRFDWVNSDVDLSPLPSASLLAAYQAAKNTTQTATTGSLGLAYELSNTLQLVGSVGTSFRMPWTSEMFSSAYSGSTYTIANPGLKPEYGTNIEFGPRWHFDNASLGMTLFHSRFRNFLQLVQTGTYLGLPAYQRQNVGRAKIEGMEIEGRWQMTSQLNFYGNASYLYATNETTDTPLPSIAPLSGLAGVQFVGRNQAYSLNGELQWAKGQTRYASASEYPKGGYGVINLSAQLQLDRLGLPSWRNTQLIFGLTNLFDKSYSTAATASTMTSTRSYLNPLIAPSRSMNVTLRTRF